MTAALILAAGASTRLGQPKQLVQIAGETLLQRAIRISAEAGLSPVYVVLPAARPDLKPQLPASEYIVLENAAAAEGIASSIRVGVAALRQLDVTGAVILACDQPSVTPAHLRRLVSSPGELTASRYAGRIGVPAYFAASNFPNLLELHGDKGARDLLTGAAAIDLPDGDLDVDTPMELARARALYESAWIDEPKADGQETSS